MSTHITLDDIKKAAAKKYASFTIGLGEHEIELRNALKLSKDERNRVSELQDEMVSEESDRDQEDILRELLTVLCATEGQGNKLVEAIGDDLTVMAEIFSQYQDVTQLGEASPSQD